MKTVTARLAGRIAKRIAKTSLAVECALLLMVITLGDVSAQPHIVVLVTPSAAHPTAQRLHEELVVMGLAVDTVVSQDTSRDLAAIGAERGAVAALQVYRDEATIGLWVDPAFQRGGEVVAQTQLVKATVVEGKDPGLLALRAVEMLHGRMVPVTIADPSLEGPVAAEPAPTTAAAKVPAEVVADPPMVAAAPPAESDQPSSPISEARREFVGGLGAGFFAPAGGLGLIGQAVGTVAWFPNGGRWGGSVFGAAPIGRAEAETTNGRAMVQTVMVGGGPAINVPVGSDGIFVEAEIGAAAMAVLYEGEADMPNQARSGTEWVFFPHARLTAGLAVTSAIAVRLDAIVGATMPEPVVRIAGAEVASVGPPVALPSLSLEIRP